MPRRDWEIRIRDILDAARKVIEHVKELDFDAFAADDWTVDAVLRNFTVIGEAARHVPDAICQKYPHVPWQDMRDMRNIVVHEYFRIDLTVVWNTIQEDLPALIPRLKEVLKEEDE